MRLEGPLWVKHGSSEHVRCASALPLNADASNWPEPSEKGHQRTCPSAHDPMAQSVRVPRWFDHSEMKHIPLLTRAEAELGFKLVRFGWGRPADERVVVADNWSEPKRFQFARPRVRWSPLL